MNNCFKYWQILSACKIVEAHEQFLRNEDLLQKIQHFSPIESVTRLCTLPMPQFILMESY